MSSIISKQITFIFIYLTVWFQITLSRVRSVLGVNWFIELYLIRNVIQFVLFFLIR